MTIGTDESMFDRWEAFVTAEIDTQMKWWDAEGQAMPRTKTGEHVLAFAAACGATEALRRLRKTIVTTRTASSTREA